MEEYYCYILTDPTRNNEPFYVGKGLDDRAWTHFRRTDDHPVTRRIEKIKKAGMRPNVSIYGSLDQEFALFLEIELISKFGRRDKGTGSLWNLTDGGQGQLGNRGIKRSAEIRENMSKAKKGQKYSDEAKRNMSEAAKLRAEHFTAERNNKISKSLKGHIVTEETRKKISDHHKNDPSPNPMLGRKHSTETKEKIRQKALERYYKKEVENI